MLSKSKYCFFSGGVRVVLIDIAVGGVIEVVVTDNFVERTYVESWLLTNCQSLDTTNIYTDLDMIGPAWACWGEVASF
jgi:hypothetical protein